MKKTVAGSAALLAAGVGAIYILTPSLFKEEESSKGYTKIIVTETTEQPEPGCNQAYLPLPDPICSPGSLNPDVSEKTMQETICKPGWVDTVRPDQEKTLALKEVVLERYGYRNVNPNDFELDRVIPVVIGGSIYGIDNLFPQPHAGVAGMTENTGSEAKNSVDRALNTAVCETRVPLVEAQHEVAQNWLGVPKKLGLW